MTRQQGLAGARYTARPDLDPVRPHDTFAVRHHRRGGAGKTRTDASDLARLLAERSWPPALLFDLPGNDLRPASYRPVIADLDWPFDTPRPPRRPRGPRRGHE
uniref:Uncharacterized protein n=1 Tax=Streptomyces sp. F12 TaxID=1436084 RepID=V9Z4T8_9ACTN|nr:hypothetical protein pFRL6_398c [Streptomyces sp. F12]